MALRKVFKFLSELFYFAFTYYYFTSLINKFNRSKVYISSSRGKSELLLFIRLLPNVSYVIECICFKEISVII